MERQVLRLPDGADPLQTFEDGSPLGDTRFLDFGEGIQATLIGDDFVRVTGAAGGEMSWDALVDSTFAASDPANRLFKGIGEALAYLKTTVGLNDVAVAIRDDEATTYTETADWATPNQVFLFGIRASGDRTHFDSVAWDWNGFKPATVMTTLKTFNIALYVGLGPTQRPCGDFEMYDGFLQIGNLNGFDAFEFCQDFQAYNSRLSMVGNSTGRLATGSALFVGCDIENSTISGGSQTFIPCGTTNRLMLEGCYLVGSSPNVTWTLPTQFHIITSGQGGGTTYTFTVPADAKGYIRHLKGDGTALVITATANFDRLHLDGEFSNITATGTHENFVLVGSGFSGTWDIRGPASIDISAFASLVVIVRGEGVSGHIAADGLTGTSGTFLDFIAADYCNIHVGADPTGTSSTKKAYALDASSNNNGLWFDDTGWPVAGTNAGTSNLILPGAVPSGGAGPNNADYLVGTANASLSSEIVVGTTPGGELGGTWAAPTVDATHSGSPHGVAIEDEGAAEGQALTVDFAGAGVSVGFAGTEATVTIPGVGTPTAGWGSITNAVTDRVYDANATTIDELADVLATLVADLIAQGVIAT